MIRARDRRTLDEPAWLSNTYQVAAEPAGTEAKAQTESGSRDWQRSGPDAGGQLFIEKAYALLVFAGIWSLMQGFIDIMRAFQIRKLGKLV